MKILKHIFILFILLVITTITSAREELLTNRNLKLLNKAIEKHLEKHSGLTHDNRDLAKNEENLVVLEITRKEGANLIGWGCLAKAKGRQDYFDFLVLYDNNKEVIHLEILQYRSSHGYQIDSKRWLSNFKGLSVRDTIEKGQQVDGISGATMSVEGLIQKMNEIGEVVDGL
ncbi:MAG: FMN-binding protein [Bacteroidota bacterium]